ncbi:MAG: hypothetical protein Q7S23_02960 [bacterium]|nr:hypothetical protein [bacterium]
METPPPSFSRNQRLIYRILVLVLFQLLGFVAHAAVEIPIALMLAQDFDRFGITYEQWLQFHAAFSWTLQIIAFAAGWLVGASWWKWLTRTRANVRPYQPPIQYG